MYVCVCLSVCVTTCSPVGGCSGQMSNIGGRHLYSHRVPEISNREVSGNVNQTRKLSLQTYFSFKLEKGTLN